MLALVKVVFLAGMILSTPAQPWLADSTHQAAPPALPQAVADSQQAPQAQAPLGGIDTSARISPQENPVLLAQQQDMAGELAVQAAALKAEPDNAVVATNAPRHNPPMQDTLAHASSRSAVSATRLLGASVAYAADLPPVTPVAPPPPTVRPMDSPITPERLVRPDEITPQAPPPPEVAPYVSRDSAAQKQAELNRREQELLALQQQMEARMTELHSLENRIQGMLQDATTTQDNKLSQLIDMYSNMKPRVAAQALQTVEETVAVKILTGMKPKLSGEIMSYMEPVHAARLSEVMSKMQM